jgi:hypothetical protein
MKVNALLTDEGTHPSPVDIFRNRTLVIATKHGKEQVIAPVLEEKLGVKCILPSNLDTDNFGTFSGEIERKEDPLQTARDKCMAAMDSTGCDLAIASEGSFGPHPSLFFIQSDDELLLMIDKRNKLEIAVREISTRTNFNGQVITSESELYAFAEKVHFPSHGLILRRNTRECTEIVKGITKSEDLLYHFREFRKKYSSVFIETDMRALYNPMRMQVIRIAAVKLIGKIMSTCPVCNTPGFGITEVRSGLPCAICNSPTESTSSHIYRCLKCGFQKTEQFPNGKLVEDPMYCHHCNP